MIRKTLPLLIAGFITLSLHAQHTAFRSGIQVRAAYSDLDVTYPGNPEVTRYFENTATVRFAPAANAWLRYDFNPWIGLQAALGYQLSGYRIKEFDLIQSTPDMPEPVFLGRAKGRVNYHDMDLSLSFRLKPLSRMAGWFYITGGIAQLFNIGRSQTVHIEYDNGLNYDKTERFPAYRSVRDWNLRGDAGIGFELNGSGKRLWYIEPVYSRTFYPVFKESETRYFNYSFGLNIGMGF